MKRSHSPNFRPVVDGFNYHFDWNRQNMPGWDEMFDKQLEVVREDIVFNKSQSDLIIYLSCPISNRGGGFHHMNVLISEHTAARIKKHLGSRVWVLNPSQYQMESSYGNSLLSKHAREIDVDMNKFKPRGGDYMRMWTKALLEDEHGANAWGRYFDGFYFLSQYDVHAFFQEKTGIKPITDAVYAYLSQRIAMHEKYRTEFLDPKTKILRKQRTEEFVHYYALAGGAASSSGCRDEWNIWVLLNRHWQHQNEALKYMERDEKSDAVKPTGVGENIPGYYNGEQLSLADDVQLVAPGYGKFIE